MILTIDKLLTMPEGKTLEFKQNLSSPKNFLKTPELVEGLLLPTQPGAFCLSVWKIRQIT